MTDWYLDFEPKSAVTLEVGKRLLQTVVGEPVDVHHGELNGNPRDFYSRTITITARSPVEPMQVELGFVESTRGEGDPEASIQFGGVRLHTLEAPFAMMLATWHALRAAFAELGCTDRTLPGATMVDDAEAAGDLATGHALRAQATAQLLAKARVERSGVEISLVRLVPGGVEALLAAYPDPSSITSVRFWDVGIAALPAGFERFTEISHLMLLEDKLDPGVLRGLVRPQLALLNVSFDRLRHVTREDVVGFPGLGHLVIENCPLEELDDDIIEVCPNLYNVTISGTPLAKNARRLAELQARWPRVHTWGIKGLLD